SLSLLHSHIDCGFLCTENTVQSTTSAHVVHLGMTTTINCDYNKTSEKETFRVYLRREQLLCSYFHQLKSWRKQSCKENIRLIWIPETEEVSFELVNLQINDTGVYTCAVERLTPPPVQTLGNQRTSLHVIGHCFIRYLGDITASHLYLYFFILKILLHLAYCFFVLFCRLNSKTKYRLFYFCILIQYCS
uniref:Immunoglobulin domain-containing protein n=1 Tax=Astyanax mexicanus TaxID=7994 RepID=A0A3B1IXM5_ASTMX